VKTSKFERECSLVNRLLDRWHPDFGPRDFTDPNSLEESGADVELMLDNERIGIQVTELDNGLKPGLARGSEKIQAKTANGPGGAYFNWGPSKEAAIAAIQRAVRRKTMHTPSGFVENWLLISADVPEHGSVYSTSMCSIFLTSNDLDAATNNILASSAYDRVFLHPILAPDRAIFGWLKSSGVWSEHRNLPEGPTLSEILGK